ncbi:MAG: hypothetical protein M1368_11095 [Thaumarchaeota archaeon]|nr:hypothetical protein [Nitrososphaerota archaeon]
MATTETTIRRRRSNQILTADLAIKLQVPEKRREEIRRYLKLFGYKPDRSILQVHVAGYFGRGMRPPREIVARERAAARYGGRTFTVVGRTHDPELLAKLIPPRKKEVSSPGYMGYLFQRKDKEGRAPDDMLPLDFTPTLLHYPKEWKDLFGTRGYLIAIHVPSDFARKKNVLLRKLRQIRGNVDVKKEWEFLNEVAQFGYDSTTSTEVSK